VSQSLVISQVLTIALPPSTWKDDSVVPWFGP